MHDANLRSVDLNLLLVLNAVLSERHITRAATRLNLSQPAVSHALGRLRQILGDPLLVRRGRQMVPTSRALALAHKVELILAEINGLLITPRFDPAAAKGSVTICATEGALGILFDALSALQTKAPHLTVKVTTETMDVHRRLRTGAVDLYFDAHSPVDASEFSSTEVLKNELLAVGRTGSFAEPDYITRDEYERRPHVIIAGGTHAQFTSFLDTINISRRVAAEMPGYFSAASFVSRTDFLVTLPDALATSASAILAVETRRLPFSAPPVSLSLSWHRRHAADPLHSWVRELLVQGARASDLVMSST
jgi:DNA-binding transcriptional LysR family regulator